MIATEKLGKRYGEKTVLSGVTLELPKEKIIAFIGGNGTGKSTLLSLITRTLSKSEGKVMVDGTELSDWTTGNWPKTVHPASGQRPEHSPDHPRTGCVRPFSLYAGTLECRR